MGIIHERIKELNKNYSTLEVLKFDEFLRTCESTEIIEDFKSVFIEPTKGAQFAKEFVLTNTLGENDLNVMKGQLESVMASIECEGYTNEEHITMLESTLELVKSKLMYVQESSVSELLIDSMYLQELAPVSEAAVKTEKTLKSILSKDLSDEDKIKLANKVIERLKNGTAPLNTAADITNVITITSIVLYTLVVAVPVTVATILLPAPIVIVNRLINSGTNKATRSAYLRTFKTELKKIDSAIASGESNANILTYKKNLTEAITTLQDSKEKINLESVIESAIFSNSLQESVHDIDLAIMESYYNFVFSENETVEESVNWFNDIIKLSNVKQTMIQESVNMDLCQEAGKYDGTPLYIKDCIESLRAAKTVEAKKAASIKAINKASIVYELTYMYRYIKTKAFDARVGVDPSLKSTAALFTKQGRADAKEFKEWAYGDELKNLVDKKKKQLETVKESFEDIDVLMEGKNADEARKKVNVTANKLKSKAQKVKDKVKNSAQAGKAAANHVNNAGKAMDDAATNAVHKAKNVYRNDVRGEIIESKTTVKFGRIIRKGIMIGSLTMVNPALGAIGALTTLALRKNVKEKERRKILRELEEELEIVNEKIEDSRGDENKEKKYQLMRIRNKLQKDITRIQYGLKSDDKGV